MTKEKDYCQNRAVFFPTDFVLVRGLYLPWCFVRDDEHFLALSFIIREKMGEIILLVKQLALAFLSNVNTNAKGKLYLSCPGDN